MAFRFDEIRAFTTDEIGKMQSELDRIAAVIAQKQMDLDSVKSNPLNYVIETQRDAMTRMENSIKQDVLVGGQLINSRDATIESGDTDKLQRWFDLSSTVGDAADIQVWNQQKDFASTAHMVATVASDTAGQIKNPFGLPWWLWVGGIAALLLGVGRRR